MSEIKAILMQDGEPTPNNPVEIKRLLVNKEAEDYITNLQEENKELETENEKLTQLWLNSQERRRKAIEYIEEHIKYECDGTYSGVSFYSHHLYDNFKKEDLLNILQGEDKE